MPFSEMVGEERKRREHLIHLWATTLYPSIRSSVSASGARGEAMDLCVEIATKELDRMLG